MEIKDILTRCDQLDEDLGPYVSEEFFDVLSDELVLHDIAAVCTCMCVCVCMQTCVYVCVCACVCV